MNDYYNHGTYPIYGTQSSPVLEGAEFDKVMAGFAKLPSLAGNGYKIVYVNAAGDALTVSSSVTFDSSGNLLVPTAAAGTNTTQAASTAFVIAQAMAAALPAQAGNSGKSIITTGSVAGWGVSSPIGGGTGVANNPASTIAISGAYASTFTLTNTTSVTFPTSGTLLSSAAAVTVAQGGTGLATLAANNVILGNGASNPTFVAPGTSGNVLTSNGSTWQSAAPPSSAMTLLSVTTASSSATVDIETTFDGTYDEYLIIATEVLPGTNNVALQMLMKIGGSYVTTATYAYSIMQCISSSTTISSSANGESAAAITLNPSYSNVKPLYFEVKIHNPASTTKPKGVTYDGVQFNTSSVNAIRFTGTAMNTGTAALTGIRFQDDSGNIASGTFRLYGIKKS